MDLAIQLVQNDKTVRDNTILELKEFNNNLYQLKLKKGEQLITMMPAIKKAFNLMGDDIIELDAENKSLKNKIGNYDEKWLEESKARLLKQIDDDKRASIIMERMKKQLSKKQQSDS